MTLLTYPQEGSCTLSTQYCAWMVCSHLSPLLSPYSYAFIAVVEWLVYWSLLSPPAPYPPPVSDFSGDQEPTLPFSTSLQSNCEKPTRYDLGSVDFHKPFSRQVVSE